MELTQLFLGELEREAERTRRTLEQVPAGLDEWKPHAKSMPLGRLAGLVASMPSWVTLIIEQEELNLTPPAGQGQFQQPTTDTLVQTLDRHVTAARESLSKTNDEFLFTTNWRLLAGGKVVMDQPRHIVLRDTLQSPGPPSGPVDGYCDSTIGQCRQSTDRPPTISGLHRALSGWT